MNYLIHAVLIISSLFGIAYFSLILGYCYAWIKMKPPVFFNDILNTKVSVIIAARNEELTIINCLNALKKQTYPSKYFEIIIVDDASEDNTNNIIKEFCTYNKNVKLLTIKSSDKNFGKKNAITKAINIAEGELIVTTDADCVMDINWLTTIVLYYKQTNAKMIVSPVAYFKEKNIFEKMQTLEFMSLMISSGASLFYNKAIMCNGANLAYTKKAFEEVNGFEGINNVASGDDVLLMYKIKELYYDGIKYLKHRNAIVFTKPKDNLKSFISQRKRWASKSFKLLNSETQLVSVIVAIFNLSLFIILPLSLLNLSKYISSINLVKFYFLLFGIKCLIDFLLLFLASAFFKKKISIVYFFIEEFLYVFYIVLIMFSSFISEYEWKGRKTK